MDKPTKLNFSDCTLLKLDKLFLLDEQFESPILDAWLKETITVTDFEQQTLNQLQQQLNINVKHWNEAELLQNFIAPLFALVDFSSNKQFSLFSERQFGGTVDGILLSGQPDGMIAQGFREPEQPYFCTSYASQEYKKELDPQGDPAGQALAAMLVGQEMNEQEYPLYGCYVVGANWYFMILHQRQYVISSAYVATKTDIVDILQALKRLKAMIMAMVLE
ncbi:hypothetical protein QUF64_00020 [Anaerolineales bacterium HSG6]|nr:hypothetical protein [Anaerolineales bacterium HSG6]